MKRKINESLMSAIVGGIMNWAVKKDIDKDPAFKKTISDYNNEIARLSKELETILSNIAKK